MESTSTSGQDSADRSGATQYVAVTRLLKFQDDIVVRVRLLAAAGDVVVVDVRSRSRVGQGDLGANGARILAYQRRLAEVLKQRNLPQL